MKLRTYSPFSPNYLRGRCGAPHLSKTLHTKKLILLGFLLKHARHFHSMRTSFGCTGSRKTLYTCAVSAALQLLWHCASPRPMSSSKTWADFTLSSFLFTSKLKWPCSTSCTYYRYILLAGVTKRVFCGYFWAHQPITTRRKGGIRNTLQWNRRRKQMGMNSNIHVVITCKWNDPGHTFTQIDAVCDMVAVHLVISKHYCTNPHFSVLLDCQTAMSGHFLSAIQGPFVYTVNANLWAYFRMSTETRWIWP